LEQCVHEVGAQGVNHILVQADISKQDEVQRMFLEVVQKLGGLDILIHNSGIQIAADSHEMSIVVFGISFQECCIRIRSPSASVTGAWQVKLTHT